MTAKGGLGDWTLRLGEADRSARLLQLRHSERSEESHPVSCRRGHRVDYVFVVSMAAREHGRDSSSRTALLRMTANGGLDAGLYG
jgi:hypothetical protein